MTFRPSSLISPPANSCRSPAQLPLISKMPFDIVEALREAISIAREPGAKIVGIACDEEPLLEEIAE